MNLKKMILMLTFGLLFIGVPVKGEMNEAQDKIKREKEEIYLKTEIGRGTKVKEFLKNPNIRLISAYYGEEETAWCYEEFFDSKNNMWILSIDGHVLDVGYIDDLNIISYKRMANAPEIEQECKFLKKGFVIGMKVHELIEDRQYQPRLKLISAIFNYREEMCHKGWFDLKNNLVISATGHRVSYIRHATPDEISHYKGVKSPRIDQKCYEEMKKKK